jgi:diacylglycerol kinase family enzyme
MAGGREERAGESCRTPKRYYADRERVKARKPAGQGANEDLALIMLSVPLMGATAVEPRVDTARTPTVTTVLLNASSGAAARAPGGEHPALAPVREAFAAAGLDVSVVITAGDRLADAARSAVDRGVGLVVAGGGDGTIGTVASVLADTPATLGVLPLGTLNHFAKDVGIPLDVTEAVGVIAAGHATRVDVAEVNGLVFINNSSLGLYPSLVYQREKRQDQGRSKWVAFAIAIARVWRQYRRVRVVIHSEQGARVVRTPFVFIGNNEYRLEGVRFGARERIDAAVLHVSMAPGITRGELLRVLGYALLGKLADVDHFDTLVTSEVTIAAWRRHLPVALDGEVRLIRTPLRYRVRPGVLRVCVPADPPPETPTVNG